MALRLAEHAEQDRPRERLWAVGPAALTAQELLAILLGTGCAHGGGRAARAGGRLPAPPRRASLGGVGADPWGGTQQGRARGGGAGAGTPGGGRNGAPARADPRAHGRAALLRCQAARPRGRGVPRA